LAKLKINQMKIFNILFRKEKKKASILAIFLASTTFVACEKSDSNQIAEERFIVTELKINTTEQLPLLIGRDSLLNITNNPEAASNRELLWETSDPSVATVDENGRVKAVSLGDATIKVTSTDGGARSSSILVQVIDRIEYATAIQFTPSNVSIFEAEDITLLVNILPVNATYKTLKWSSSNPSIANVSQSGEIVGLSKGTAIITASTTDGSGVTQTIAVEVKEVIPVTSITISTVVNETLAIDQNLPIEVTYLPANATIQSLEWTSDDERVATVSSAGLVKAIADGRATITVTAKNNPNIKSSISLIVEAGKIDDTFIDGVAHKWVTPSAGASSQVNNNILWITMNGVVGSGNRRGDFRRPNTTLHIGNYPIIAFKFTRPLPTAGNIFLDTDKGRWKHTTSSGNNQMTILLDKNNEQVFYADLGSFNTFGTAGFTLPTNAAHTFTQISVGVADMPSVQNPLVPFPVYWIKTFKTLAELQAYMNR
jgi:uncharacterized protein YjdB